MGIFSKKPDPKEVKAFGRGRAVSGRAAEEWARQQGARKRAVQMDRARRAANRQARKGR